MSERTIYLDGDPRDWRCRKIHVWPQRWYSTVELDRDGYVDAASSRGHTVELANRYTEAVKKVQAAAVDRLWYDGYPGDLAWGTSSRSVTLDVPYTKVEAAVEALCG